MHDPTYQAENCDLSAQIKFVSNNAMLRMPWWKTKIPESKINFPIMNTTLRTILNKFKLNLKKYVHIK